MPPRPATPRITWSANVAPIGELVHRCAGLSAPAGRCDRVRTRSDSQSEAKNARNSGTSAHISGCTSRARPMADHHRDVAEHAEADAGADRERQRDAGDHQEGRDAGLRARPVDVGDQPDHQVADHDQRGRDRRVAAAASPTITVCPTTAISGTKKIVSRKQIAVTTEARPGARALGHAGAGLDVGGDARDAHRAAARRRRRVDQQQALQPRRLAALVQQAAGAATPRPRCRSCRRSRSRTARRSPARAPTSARRPGCRGPARRRSSRSRCCSGSRRDLVRRLEHAEDQAEHGRGEDADQDRASDAARGQDDHHQQAGERDQRRRRR